MKMGIYPVSPYRTGFGRTAFLIILIISLLVTAGLVTSCRKTRSYEKPLTPVRTQSVVEQYTTGGAARYSANIQPNTQVDLAFKIGGYIESIFRTGGRTVQEGDWIAKGTLLAKIGETELSARVSQAMAQLAEARAAQSQIKSQLTEAQAAQENSKLELDRATKLFAADSLIKSSLDAAKARFDMGQARIDAIGAQLAMTQAKIDAAKAQLEEAESFKKNCELRAPMSGLLLRRTVEVGSLVAPGAPAFTLADTNSVKAVFGVPDVETPKLKIGSSLNVASEAISGVEMRGRLARVSPLADPKTRIFDVEVMIPNPGRRLKVGMVVSLEVAAGKTPTLVTVVPLPAIFQLKEKTGGYGVFVVEQESGHDIARLHRVSIGETIGNMIVISSGVKAGEKIIVSGATLVSDGEKVRVIQ